MADDNPPAMSDMVTSHAVKGGIVEDDTTQPDTAQDEVMAKNTTQDSTHGDDSATIASLSNTVLDNIVDDSHAPITKLADELILLITKELHNRDLKNLRLTSKVFASKVVLSFRSLSVAMNKFDLEILRGVAERPELASQIKELVWVNLHFIDRAIAAHFENGEISMKMALPSEISHGESYGRRWPYELRLSDNDDQTAWQDSVQQFGQYKRLRSEKKAVLGSEEHIKALRDALPRLTSLRRVTIREDYCVEDLRIPEKSSYRVLRAMDHSLSIHPWSRTSNNAHHYGSVMRELWASTCSIGELIIEEKGDVLKGIPYACFEQEATSKHMKSIGARGLERLDLAIDVTMIDDVDRGLISLSGNDLHAILSEATSMKRFELRTNWLARKGTNPSEEYRHALKAVPTKRYWPTLKYLTLSHIPVAPADLFALFENLSPTIVYVGCDHLAIFDGTWTQILPQLKTRLPHTHEMLTVTIILGEDQIPQHIVLANDGIYKMTITMQHIGNCTDPEVYSYECV